MRPALLVLLTVLPAVAQYEPPPGYYATAEGLTGPALKTALHDIIDDHTIIAANGGDSFQALRVLDQDPANTNNVIAIYSGTSEAKFREGGLTWNREHCWPRSYGISASGNEASADESDLFNLRPCLTDVNQIRGDRIYDEADPAHPSDPAVAPPGAPECLYDASRGQGEIWTPRPSEKGDLARAMFYMAVRYDGSDPGTLDLELGDTADAAQAVFGNLTTLLQWHLADPVSEEERRRNHLIHERYQGNRNPFVDRPEWAAKVFGAPELVLTLERSAHEEGTTAVARVALPGPAPAPVVVRVLKTGDYDNTEVSVPATVTVPAGQSEVDFDVVFPADDTADGDQSVGLAVWAEGYTTTAWALLVLDIDGGGGSVSTAITGAGRYTENFDTLPAAGTNEWIDHATLPGWRAQRSGTGTTIIAGHGTSTGGGLYSFGPSGGADRALGSLGSGNAAVGSFAWGVTLQNTSGQTVLLGPLSYAGEQWRNSGATNAQTVTVSYQVGAAPPDDLAPGSDAGWTALPGAGFTSPVTGGTAGALEGNSAPNRAALGAALDVALAPGESVTVRWRDIDHPGTDHGLAIDDVRLDWRVLPAGLPPQPAWPATVAGRVGEALVYQLTTDDPATAFQVSGLPPGISLDPVSGQLTGQPESAGDSEVTVFVINDAGAERGTFTLQVARGTPSIVNQPVAATAEPGQPLSMVVLTGGAASVPGAFVFSAPTTIPPAGVSVQSVTFLPADGANYDTVTFLIPVTADYGSGFENAVKGSYPAGTVTVDGLSWTFDDAMIGAELNDLRNGAQSVRLRNGSLVMNTDLPGGIGEVRFFYGRANFNGDRTGNAVVFVVEYSTDQGDTWQQAGAPTSLDGIDALTAFSASVNVSSAARIRIRKVSGDSGKRWNLDDLVITSYRAPEGMTFARWSGGLAPTPELVMAYAIGGAISVQSAGEVPANGYDGATLSIEALVRTDDPTLRVSGLASTDLVAGEWSTNDVTATDIAKKPGDPADTARRVFSTPRGTDPAKFLRLRIKLGP